MASPPPPPPRPSSGGSGCASSPAPVDALFLQNLMSRVQLRPPFLDTNSFLTQDLDDFLLNEFAALSAAAGSSDDGEEDEDGGLSDGEVSGEARRRRMLAREEAKLEKEIVRRVIAGEAEEALKPNSGQSVAVGDHHVCVGFHDEAGGEYRVWEWHGHVMLFDDEDGYSAEYIYGNHLEPLATATARAKKKEREKREKDLSSGLRDLIVGDGNGVNGSKENGNGGGPRVVRRNIVNAPATPASCCGVSLPVNSSIIFPIKIKAASTGTVTSSARIILDNKGGMGEDKLCLKLARKHPINQAMIVI